MKKVVLVCLMLFMLMIIVSSQLIDDSDVLSYRIYGGIISVVGLIVIWTIMAVELLRSKEPKPKNVNLADNYINISKDELLKYNINFELVKKILYEKFKSIHIAFSEIDYDMLKIHLTDDLYNYYIEELKKMSDKGCKNIVGGFQLLKFKIYNVIDSYNMFRVDIYLNVRMYDYLIDVNTNKLFEDNTKDKRDFEFELTFIKINDDYVLSRKKCINKMDIAKEKKNKDA